MIYILYGPSGSGKSTIANEMHIDRLTTYTTRDKREEETDGQDYYFIDKNKWKKKKRQGQFLETTEYHSNYYSLSKDEIQEYIDNNKDAICVMDINGIKSLKDKYGDLIRAIYVNIPATTSFFRVFRREGLINAFKRTYTAVKNSEFNNYHIADFVLDGRDALASNTILLKFYMFLQKVDF